MHVFCFFFFFSLLFAILSMFLAATVAYYLTRQSVYGPLSLYCAGCIPFLSTVPQKSSELGHKELNV